MCFNTFSDGSGSKAIIIEDGGLRNGVSKDSFAESEIEPNINRSRLNLSLNGHEVFNFSVTKVPPSIKEILGFARLQVNEIDYCVLHQANKIMNDTIMKKCGFTIEQTPSSLLKFGNTSSASVPLTIVTQLQEKVMKKNRFLFSGFGVGLSWANCILETEHLVCPTLIEI
jgi:3-oxoacyl-[acyl-carrier-protein] synthase-3